MPACASQPAQETSPLQFLPSQSLCPRAQFSEQSYWDARFKGEPLGYEWYRNYASLRPIITRWAAG